MRISDRVFFGGLAIVSIGLLSSGLALGEIYRLQPCYWCNFQRFLYISLAGVSLLGPHVGFAVANAKLWAMGVKLFSQVIVILSNYIFSKVLIFKKK